jgi:hypothetical protein
MFLGVQFSWISIAINAYLDFYPELDLCYAIFTADIIGFVILECIQSNYLDLPLFLGA